MEIRSRNFDVEKCMHDIAMEWAKRDLDVVIAEGDLSPSNVTGCLDLMFDSYVQAFGYLSRMEDDYIKTLLEHP